MQYFVLNAMSEMNAQVMLQFSRIAAAVALFSQLVARNIED